ncbi:MAG: hypothetical protein Q4C66_05900 [Lachnospiraceae bacterium]|nr:hypothetical protein [Lachnospiraceae bacterium]
MTVTKEAAGNRQHKDRLFRRIFQEKEDLLSLYNAVNGSHYTDPEELEITTIEDVLYMGIKNDISFLIDDYLNLYEAQSSWNPNMPLRGIFYFSSLYSGYVKVRKLDLYSRSRIMIPTPRFVVFYNGTRREPERRELRLSDSFIKSDNQPPSLECVAVVLNINYGQNKELMKNCRKLYEYAFLVNQIRIHIGKGLTLEAAIDEGIAVCVEQDILTEFLTKHKAEVREMILSEYDEELHLKDTYHCGYEDGRSEGRKEGRIEGEMKGESLFASLAAKLIKDSRMDDLTNALKDEEFRRRLYREYGIK